MVVYRFVQGELTQSSAREVAKHAEQCAECRELISSLMDERPPHGDAHTLPRDLEATTDDLEARSLLDAFRRDRENLSGQLFADKYLLGRRLGVGGMGVVYQAVNTWTGRQVAIKLLHPWFSSDEETVNRFRREATSATRINHPSIVEVLDMGVDPRDGSLYMVQEFLTGDTLRQHLTARQRLSVAETATILIPIMDALAA